MLKGWGVKGRQVRHRVPRGAALGGGVDPVWASAFGGTLNAKVGERRGGKGHGSVPLQREVELTAMGQDERAAELEAERNPLPKDVQIQAAAQKAAKDAQEYGKTLTLWEQVRIPALLCRRGRCGAGGAIILPPPPPPRGRHAVERGKGGRASS